MLQMWESLAATGMNLAAANGLEVVLVSDITKIVHAMASNESVAESLERLLPHPDDRAYVQCFQVDCEHYRGGHCTIHTVTALNAIGPEKPCADYKIRQ